VDTPEETTAVFHTTSARRVTARADVSRRHADDRAPGVTHSRTRIPIIATSASG